MNRPSQLQTQTSRHVINKIGSHKKKTPQLPRNWYLGRDVVLKTELATGGEGKIHTIEVCNPDIARQLSGEKLVAKLFHHPDEEKTIKLQFMVNRPPYDPTYADPNLRHRSIAWPLALLHEPGNTLIAGFVMPYIDQKQAYPLIQIYNPRDRLQTNVPFTWRYLLRMVTNLTRIVEELHRAGYVIGDLNESNILANRSALVTIVDCDSLQVPNPATGGYFRCGVGKPEYTPPELLGLDFRQVDRSENHDHFSLAVLIFLMLMEGLHPFSAGWEGEGIPPSLEENIHAGIFPYIPKWEHLHPAYALSLKVLPGRLRWLMKKVFVYAHQPLLPFLPLLSRPDAYTWQQALEKTEKRLRICEKNPSHEYSRHLGERCPWCERVNLGIPDSFPSPKQTSRQLPVVPLSEPAKRRKAPQRRTVGLLALVLVSTLAPCVPLWLTAWQRLTIFQEQLPVTIFLLGFTIALVVFKWYRKLSFLLLASLYILEVVLCQTLGSPLIRHVSAFLFSFVFIILPIIILFLLSRYTKSSGKSE